MNETIQNTSDAPMTMAQVDHVQTSPSEEQTVRLWRNRIKDAQKYFEADFQRMTSNMEFAAGIQWPGQETIDDQSKRYISNFITKHINDKVAALYAKDPKCEAKIRKRLNYELWDGSVEQEWNAVMAVQGAMIAGQLTPEAMQAGMLLQDIQQGKLLEKQLEKLGKTLEILYGYECDTQSPSFKFQMKQLVRRVITTGVGFVRLNYVTEGENVLSAAMTDDSLASRVDKAKQILFGIANDKISDDDPRIEQLRLLFSSIEQSMTVGDQTNIEERIEFDFPDSSRIIVDPKCKSLKGFIGAKWIAQRYIMSLEDANAYFKLYGDEAVTPGGDFVEYANDGAEKPHATTETQPKDPQKSPLGCFWEVFDLTTKTSFFICDGWRWYVQKPSPPQPSINRFWPIFALTFNDIETEEGSKVHIYPPSDVQLLKPIQIERNRCREELKLHRQTNRPFFGVLSGSLEPADEDKFANHETGELVRFKKVPMNNNGQENVEGAVWKWEGQPIDRNCYDTTPLEQDASLAIGSNQIQQGLPIRHVAATPAVIQEQARMSGNSSNVDDLDDLLSELAQSSGEIVVRVFKPETIIRIVGRGAFQFPTDPKQREDLLNQVYLSIVAASSGRPNKAVDIQNAQQLIPLMLQAGANPWACIEYLVTVLDANIDPAKFAPPTPPMQPQGQPPQGQPSQKPQHPNKPMMHNQQPGRVGNQPGGQGLMPGVQQGGPH